ncbi:MAG: hypothetical protein R6V01_07235 [Thermoplasmatota archaeon]
MRAIEVLNETLYFFKENFNQTVTVAGEGFLIQMIMNFIVTPFAVLLVIPMMFFPLMAEADIMGMMVILIVLYALFTLVSITVQSLAMSIMLGGEVYALDRIKKGHRVRFGDVFRYGWRNKFPLLGVFFFNFLLFFGIVTLPLFMIFFLSATFLPFNPLAMVLFMVVLIFLMLAIAPIQMGMIPLPFLIRNRLGTGPVESVLEAWKFYFKHFTDLYLMGLFFLMMTILVSMVPLLNIVAQVAMYPAVITSELIYLDDVLGIQRFRPRYIDRNQMQEQMGQ